MIKKLVPAAVLLSIMGVAQAQAAAPAVSVYGLIDMSYGKSIADAVDGKKADFHSGGDDSSGQGNSTTKVGLKGSADVGSGIKANFKLETNGITSDGKVNAPTFGRAAWAGFSGSFGEVRLGRQDSVPFQTMAGFDLNGAANMASAQGNAGVGPWTTGRQSRSLQYISPAMSGVTAQAGFVPAGNVAGAKAVYSLAVSYSQGPLGVAVAGESKHTDAAGDKAFMSVAGNYDLGVVKLMAGYAEAEGRKGPSVGVVAPVAGFNIGMQYSKNTTARVAATEFFVNRQVFKNTYAYFDYGHQDKVQPTLVTAPVKAGSGYALGMIYTF